MLDADYNLYMDTQQAINLDAMRMFAELGISTAPRPQHLLLQELQDQPTPAELAGMRPAAQGRMRTSRP